jgi:aminoglycoside 2'-N-acetyltransferase I
MTWRAFADSDPMTEQDWEHTLGGVHVILGLGDSAVAHAAVVARPIRVGGRVFQTGYVEALVTDPAHQGLGYGSLVMERVNSLIRERFEFGALGTDAIHFYERLGWRVWRGPTSVRISSGEEIRTPDEDGSILVLETDASAGLDPDAPISCDWRPGDGW